MAKLASDKGGGILCFLRLSFSHGHGCHSTSAHTKHIGKSHKKNKNRISQTDCRYLKGISCLSYEKGICHVVNHCDQTADNAWNGHGSYCF